MLLGTENYLKKNKQLSIMERETVFQTLSPSAVIQQNTAPISKLLKIEQVFAVIS